MKAADFYTHTHTHTGSFCRAVIFSTILVSFFSNNTFADDNTISLNVAIQNARVACDGINASLSGLKTKAGINTAVTAVGTVAGGVALGTGIAKYSIDKEQAELAAKVAKLIAEKSDVPIQQLEIADEAQWRDAIHKAAYADSSVASDIQKINELEQKSKTLGNVRTGTLAASTATNIVGTAIAATNKVEEDLEENIQKCISATKELATARLAAKVENTATDAELVRAEKIISACRDYEYIDIKPINKRAIGAAVASGIGIGTGAVGTITSAVANTNNVRHEDKNYALNM